VKTSAEKHLACANEAIARGDFQVAANEYQFAIGLGNHDAKIGLAILYLAGDGVERDGRVSEGLLLDVISSSDATKKTIAHASHNLSTLYVTGAKDLDSNPEKASQYALMARELGILE
jgi:TPR repeat protein